MGKELEEILYEIANFDVYAFLASLDKPPIEVLLQDFNDLTEVLLKNLGDR